MAVSFSGWAHLRGPCLGPAAVYPALRSGGRHVLDNAHHALLEVTRDVAGEEEPAPLRDPQNDGAGPARGGGMARAGPRPPGPAPPPGTKAGGSGPPLTMLKRTVSPRTSRIGVGSNRESRRMTFTSRGASAHPRLIGPPG